MTSYSLPDLYGKISSITVSKAHKSAKLNSFFELTVAFLRYKSLKNNGLLHSKP